MAEAILDAMGETLTRWTMGSAAAPAASIWKAELGAEPQEAELRLLALSGQFLSLAVTAEPPTGLRALPDIPRLALPTVPAASRPLVRRVLAAMKETRLKADILQFLAARRWTVHPGDWMPAAGDEDAPDIYAPWCDWAEIAASAAKVQSEAGDRITAENWDRYWPAARKVALAELRRRDPLAARAVLEAKLANESADARLRLLELLATGLSDADVPFLETVATADRAQRVKALAASLLSRLGRGTAVGEDLQEIAGFFAVKMKGLLRRSRVIEFENAKTPARRQGRAALFERIDMASFASALALTPEELIAAWSLTSTRRPTRRWLRWSRAPERTPSLLRPPKPRANAVRAGSLPRGRRALRPSSDLSLPSVSCAPAAKASRWRWRLPAGRRRSQIRCPHRPAWHCLRRCGAMMRSRPIRLRSCWRWA
jgi:hypothetical protein